MTEPIKGDGGGHLVSADERRSNKSLEASTCAPSDIGKLSGERAEIRYCVTSAIPCRLMHSILLTHQ